MCARKNKTVYEFHFDEINEKTVQQYIINLRNKLKKVAYKCLDKNVLEFIYKLYPNSDSLKEYVYRAEHLIKDRPVCKVCGNQVSFNPTHEDGYSTYCSSKCCALDKSPFKNPEIQHKIKSIKLEKYGDPHFNNRDKCKQTCLSKYGTENAFGNLDIFNRYKQTMIEHWGVPFSAQNQDLLKQQQKTQKELYGGPWNPSKVQKTNIEKYGVPFFTETNQMKIINKENAKDRSKKCCETKKKNGTLNSSKIEKQLLLHFDETHKDNFIYQYHSDKYPFNCDFYLKDYDLYIEIQGTWLHGQHPFNENDKNDIQKLENWKSKNTKFYDNAIETWTIRDVKKRNIAKENHLNYLEIFSNDLQYCINAINEKIRSLKETQQD